MEVKASDVVENYKTRDVLFEVKGHVGIITLNRPNALNALSFDMFKAMFAKLKTWKQDDKIHAVVIQASPARAFCAGGDVRWVYDMGTKAPEEALQLFYIEYQLNHLTSDFGKPYIALIDGVNIGGGVGVTLHGSHRVASETFSFTMPETSIGFYPDIGSSHLLANTNGGYGLYLGLTGRKVNAKDAHTLNFIDYTVRSEQFSEVLQKLCSMDLSSDANAKVSDVLSKYHESMPEGSFTAEKEEVSGCFDNKETLNDIFEALRAHETTWAISIQEEMLALSPTSLYVTFEQLKRARGLTLAECLSMDYTLTYHFLQGHDFYEGVRARLVDKDKSPKWQPSSFQSISTDDIKKYFEHPKKIDGLW